MDPPARFGTGVENRVFGLTLSGTPPFGGSLVLRLYGEGTEGRRARVEATVQNAVVDQGFPAPKALHTCEDADVLGAPFLLMQRLPGRPMLEPSAGMGAGLFAPILNWRGLLIRMPNVVAETMASLHLLDVSALRRALHEASIDPDELSMSAHLRGIEQLGYSPSRIDRSQQRAYTLRDRPPAAFDEGNRRQVAVNRRG